MRATELHMDGEVAIIGPRFQGMQSFGLMPVAHPAPLGKHKAACTQLLIPHR
jgi:hypothetical protein